MPAGFVMTPGLRQWSAAACTLLSLALLLLSLACLRNASVLQATLDAEPRLRFVEENLREPLARDQLPLLRERMRQLLNQADLGLDYLEVADAAGIVLAAFGRHENWSLPLLPEALLRRLRLARYRLGADFGRASINDGDRAVGRFDYAISPVAARQVHDAAVRQLRTAGIVGLLLSLPLAVAMLWLLRRRWLHAAAAASTDSEHSRHLARRLNSAHRLAGAPTPADEAAAISTQLRERVGSTLDELAVAFLATDRDGIVRYLNRTAEQLSGWPASAAIGQQLYSVLHTLDEAGAPQRSAAEQCLDEGHEVPRQRGRLRSRSGEEIAIEMMAAPLKDADGVPDGVVMLFSDFRERLHELDELRRQSRLTQAVIDHLDEGLITTDRAGVVRSANARALHMFGYSREEIDGFTVGKLMPVPFLNTPNVSLNDYIAVAAADAARRQPRVVGWRKDATTFPVELEVQPLTAGADSGLILIARDVSERLRGENLAQRLGRLLDAAMEEIYIFDAQTLQFIEINRGARRNLGVSEQQLLGMTPLDISAELDVEVFHANLAALRSGGREQVIYQCRHRRADGSDYAVEVRLSYSREEQPPVFMAIATDISDRVVAEEKLRRLAHHDALTGLPNRRVLHERIREAIREAAERGTRSAVLFLDLDRFKLINDSLGHDAGDIVLRCTAERLNAAVRSNDTVVRLGGDEFAVLAYEVSAAEDAEHIAQKLLAAFVEPMDVRGQPQRITPSIGIALYPDHGLGTEDLLRNADAAMYQAKQAGRACYRMYSSA